MSLWKTTWKTRALLAFTVALIGLMNSTAAAQPSVARQWNEALLEAIRNDFARPPVHARNLFHTSIALYDAWAVFDETASPYLLGRTVGNSSCSFSGVPASLQGQAAQEEAMSFAAYRLLRHRFAASPRAATTLARFDALMTTLGYDSANTSTDYATGGPAALGNYLAQCLISLGLRDGSNEQNDYANQFYEPVNAPLVPILPGNPNLTDPNRWQPLSFDVFIDQAGFPIYGRTPTFLSPEWGQVTPFALPASALSLQERDGYTFWVYHNPGDPPHLNVETMEGLSEEYVWTFALVAVWSSHLDANDGVLWDISPASIGNNPPLPKAFKDHRDFYNLLEGGDPGPGHAVNPYTGKPYKPQRVPRGDYTRVLAEFWADGPDSETPPGHWFTILNYVSDHPALEKRFRGQGPILDPLEWDVKAYLTLGGAMHDAAITAWGVKGCYDYIRPISAIRSLAARGQSTDPDRPNYHPAGIPLIPGFIEVVEEGDPLAGDQNKNVGKIKLYAWAGHKEIDDPAADVAGVRWILAENWWPYQRPSFVTPPFAGYISGHSTFSRAAAEVLTLLTGDAYFPGGMGEFQAKKNEFLVFEDGPSVDMTLQWATYRDASDQTSLSRIWGGIHPPADDIPGRLIGREVGVDAFLFAEKYFEGQPENEAPSPDQAPDLNLFPHPIAGGNILTIEWQRPASTVVVDLYNAVGQRVRTQVVRDRHYMLFDTDDLASGVYLVQVQGESWSTARPVVVVK